MYERPVKKFKNKNLLVRVPESYFEMLDLILDKTVDSDRSELVRRLIREEYNKYYD